MAAPDLQSSASDDLATVGAPPAAFDGQRSTFAEDPRWADYCPQPRLNPQQIGQFVKERRRLV